MAYDRPPNNDFRNAAEFEEHVHSWLGEHVSSHTNSTVEMDFSFPGWALDVKEKRQPLTERWHLLHGFRHEDLAVIDELSVRKAMDRWPTAFFLFRDVPCDRVFHIPIWEMVGAPHVRVDRETGPNNHRKGKWVFPLTVFRQLDDPAAQLLSTISSDIQAKPWKNSECLSHLEVPTV